MRSIVAVLFVILLTLSQIRVGGAVAGGEPSIKASDHALDRRVDQALYEVIALGTELYNSGDLAGCCRLFEGSLMTVRPLLAHRPAVQKAIAEGLTAARRIPKMDERAFELRKVMDRVRQAIALVPAARSVPTKPPRAQPPDKLRPGTTEEKYVPSAEERAVLDLTNQERAKEKLPPLRLNARLGRAARRHSANMASQDKMAHELDGKSPGDRVELAGYVPAGWGENIAAGYRTPAEAMAGWMSSKGHRENILNPGFVDIGVGIVVNESGQRYFTQVFGTPWRQ